MSMPPTPVYAYLLLCVGPPRDLDDHVQDGLLLVGVEGDVVEGRDRHAILLDEDAVLKGVSGADLARGVDGRGLGLEAAAGRESLLSHCAAASGLQRG